MTTRKAPAKFSFVVPGPILGYRASVRRAFDPKYRAWKDRILILAMASGYPGRHRAQKEDPPTLSVTIKWKRCPRIDWSNVVKSVEDALWSDDRYVVPGRFEWVTSSDSEALEIEVEYRGGMRESELQEGVRTRTLRQETESL